MDWKLDCRRDPCRSREAHRSVHQCHFCEYKATDRSAGTEHMMNNHPNLTLLNTVAVQLSEISRSFSAFETFKEELYSTQILDDLKTELARLRLAKVFGGAASKLSKIRVVKKFIARVYIVMSGTWPPTSWFLAFLLDWLVL